MPRYSTTRRFERDLRKLTSDQRKAFSATVHQFVRDLTAGTGFDKSLRVKGVQGTEGVWELTWAPDGRATWEYAEDSAAGDPHILWRRVGTHDIFRNP